MSIWIDDERFKSAVRVKYLGQTLFYFVCFGALIVLEKKEHTSLSQRNVVIVKYQADEIL